jgi:hypothetical protein
MSVPARRLLPPALVVLPLALLCGEPLAAGGSPAQQAQPPVFGAAVEVVRLDVIVLDKQGKPMTGLTQDDFVVEDGGQRQVIESFEPVAVAVRPVSAGRPTTSSGTRPSGRSRASAR